MQVHKQMECLYRALYQPVAVTLQVHLEPMAHQMSKYLESNFEYALQTIKLIYNEFYRDRKVLKILPTTDLSISHNILRKEIC